MERITMDANKFKITDLFKPLKSISYYKLEDLKQMTQYMNLDGKKKSDFYESVQDYFKHLKLDLIMYIRYIYERSRKFKKI